VSTNFIILGATYQKLWMFENFRRTLGKAGMCCSQWERVDHMCPKRRAGVWKKKSQSCKKKGPAPWPTGDQRWQSNKLWAAPSFAILQFLFLFYFLKFGDGPGILEEWVYSTPIFWNLPLHLEVFNLPFLIELGDFNFFPNLFG
jgi:hypothetical protein